MYLYIYLYICIFIYLNIYLYIHIFYIYIFMWSSLIQAISAKGNSSKKQSGADVHSLSLLPKYGTIFHHISELLQLFTVSRMILKHFSTKQRS